MSQAAIAWVSGRDTGLSSMAIWAHMMGAKPDTSWGRVHYPHDPDDFGRCYRLLEIMPTWRLRIGEMGRYNPQWSALADAWEELTALWEEEIGPGLEREEFFGKRAPKLYARMRDLFAEAELRATPPSETRETGA